MTQETTLGDARRAILKLKALHPVSSESEPFKTIDDYLECSVAKKIELEHNNMILHCNADIAAAATLTAQLELAKLRARCHQAIINGILPADFL